MKKRIALVALPILALTACGSSDSGTSAAPAGGDGKATAAGGDGGPALSGGAAKATAEVGKPVDLSVRSGLGDVEITVHKVTRHAPCLTGRKPQLGEFVALDVTSKNQDDPDSPTGISFSNWQAVDSSGTVTEADGGPTMACFKPADQFPITFEGAKQVRGTVIVDVPPGTAAVRRWTPYEVARRGPRFAASALVRTPHRLVAVQVRRSGRRG